MAEELNADEIARQVAQQIGQSISEAISKLLQSQANTQGTSQSTTQRNLEDVSEVERYAKEGANESSAWHANVKRSYDEYQDVSLEGTRRKSVIADQALQNAVETANMVAKQVVRHGDFAVNKQWNINETDFIASNALRNAVPQDAISAAIAKAVQDALSASKA
jgi:hypothetical protein